MAGQSYEWANDLMALPSNIDKTLTKGDLIHKNQCIVLKSLLYSVAQYVEQWIGPFADQKLGLAAAAVGIEVLTLLKSGMKTVQLCAANNPSAGEFFMIVSSFGQFREIIDDTRRYCQMINRLISQHIRRAKLCNISTFEEAKLELKAELMDQIKYKVELDCKALQTTLRWACEQDKLALLNSLKSFHRFENLSRDFVLKSLIPRIEAGVCSIDSKDLSFRGKLGSGSFGEVRKASWCKIPVAVKESAGECQQAFDNEVEIFRKMMAIDSSHIVQLLGQSEKEETVCHDLEMRTCKKKCLVLELMSTDLGALINKQQIMPLLTLVNIILQIAKGMNHLHSSKVIYRDLKPSNILVKKRNDDTLLIKLADFGISKSDFATGSNIEMRGTLLYMAPEMLEGLSNYSAKVDVYSFAIVCYQILTGERLDHLMSFDKMKLKHIQDELKRKMLEKDIPYRLKDLLLACWEDEDYSRPTFADICEKLWIIKEELLLVENDMQISTHEIAHLKSQMDCLNGLNKCSVSVMPQYRTPDSVTLPAAKILVKNFCNLSYKVVDIIPFALCLASGELGTPERYCVYKEAKKVLSPFKRLLGEGKELNLMLGIYMPSDETTAMQQITLKMDYLLDFLKIYPIFHGVFLISNYKIENVVHILQQLRKALPGFTIALSLEISVDSIEKVSPSLFDQLWIPLGVSLKADVPISKVFIFRNFTSMTAIAKLVKDNNFKSIIVNPKSFFGEIRRHD